MQRGQMDKHMVIWLETGHKFLLKEGATLTSLLNSLKVIVFSSLDLNLWFFPNIYKGNKQEASK